MIISGYAKTISKSITEICIILVYNHYYAVLPNWRQKFALPEADLMYCA